MEFFGNSFSTLSHYLPKSTSDWIFLLSIIPKTKTYFWISRISSCFFVRSSLKIKKPIFSLLLSLFISTLIPNIFSILRNRNFAIFENPKEAPTITFIWLFLNFSPRDIIYKTLLILKPILNLFNAFNDAYNLTTCIDLSINLFPNSWIIVILISILTIITKRIIVGLICQYSMQKVNNISLSLFSSIIGAFSYYWFTDYGHISNEIWFDREEMRLFVICGFLVFEVIKMILKENTLIHFGNIICGFISKFICYYGNCGNVIYVKPKEKIEENEENENSEKEYKEKLKEEDKEVHKRVTKQNNQKKRNSPKNKNVKKMKYE